MAESTEFEEAIERVIEAIRIYCEAIAEIVQDWFTRIRPIIEAFYILWKRAALAECHPRFAWLIQRLPGWLILRVPFDIEKFLERRKT